MHSTHADPEDTPFVALRGVTKRFGGAQALKGVDLDIGEGEIHALVGENGAGKSTLGKIVAGVHMPDGGRMAVSGRSVRYTAPRAALADGITMIAQELALVPGRSVVDNVFLGSEESRRSFVRAKAQRQRYEALAAEAGFDLPPTMAVGRLRLADQQKVEILRALAREARLIVMDEPTAALTPDEAQRLHDIIRRLKAQGRTVVFVSHFLEEVLAIADRVTVLKDGHLVRTAESSDETPAKLITSMLGRSLDLAFPAKTPATTSAPTVLKAQDIRRGRSVHGVSIELRAGEILGVAGLVGAGRTELARILVGADRADAGTLEVNGQRVTFRSPLDGIRAGVVMLPESRKDQGLFMQRPTSENISAAYLREVSRFGWIRRAKERSKVGELMADLDIRAHSPQLLVSALSGGNQQKVLFAKWLFEQPAVLIADEPTRGIDVGAKIGLYRLLADLAARGVGVILISSEVEEILGLSHRVVVIAKGRITRELEGPSITEKNIMNAAFDSGALAEVAS